MRIQTFVPLLLATSVYALPGKDQNAKRVETPTPTPTPTPEEPPATTTEEPPATTTADEEEPEPTEDLSTDEKCGLEFNAGDADIIRDTWKNSGADAFLSDFLDENGAENWVDELFRQTVGGGKQGGSTYNCVNFPAEGSCTSPGHELCTEYEPPEMFFVHLSIANLYSSYIRLHEEMQDSMIVNLASEIKKIVDIFGPPPPEDDSIFAILIGAFVGAAALAGPVWQIASVATGAVGGLNIAAGVASQSDEEEPIDFEHDLELSLGSFYSTFADILEDTVKAIFGGKFDDLEGFDSDPVDFIKDQFAEGKMLDHTLVDPAMDEWIDAAINLIKQGLVVQSMKKEEHYVWQDYTMEDEDECSKRKHAVWMGDWCTVIAKKQGASMTGHHPYPLKDDIYDAFTGKYGFDYEEAMQNAIDCAANGGGEADLTELPPFDEVPTLPPCFVNFDVKLSDFYGIPYDPEDYE